MRCAACAHENRDGRKFCASCGPPLQRLVRRAAPQTNLTRNSAASAAPRSPRGADCGRSPREPRPRARRVRTPSTPAHLAHKIRQARRGLEGERKHITVLFADVKGSMNLSARFDPEQWFRIVEDFFEVAAEGVHRFEGTVHQFTGDGVMALFGAPVAHEDHAQRACLAALHVRDSVRVFAESVRVRHGVEFSVRMGLNSDEVVIGRISDDLSMDFAALGTASVWRSAWSSSPNPATSASPKHGAAGRRLFSAARSRPHRGQGRRARRCRSTTSKGREPSARGSTAPARADFRCSSDGTGTWPRSRRPSSGRARAAR